MQLYSSTAISSRGVGGDPSRIVSAFGRDDPGAVVVAVIDGPCQFQALSGIFARRPMNLGDGACDVIPNSACAHGTFIMGLLGAAANAPMPGLCPECILVHIPLFADSPAPEANLAELASAIDLAISAGARLINLSLAILGDERVRDRNLSRALDRAEEKGALLMAAAGNQGHFAAGQMLSHPVVVPVVAVDRSGQVLPHNNFGPSISRVGVAALGHDVWGYTPTGGRRTMSGTSIATAVATGTVARVWATRPHVDRNAMRAALARLRPRDRPAPPLLTHEALLKAIDGVVPSVDADAPSREGLGKSWIRLQGDTIVNDQNGPWRDVSQDATNAASSRQTAIPAHLAGGCACGGPPGQCNCGNVQTSSMSFVYALGTVDIRIPNQSIADELARVASTKKLRRHPGEDRRGWCYRILTSPRQTSGAVPSRFLDVRHLARQLEWILTVEGVPAYYLLLSDPVDLDDLIQFLGEPDQNVPLGDPHGDQTPKDTPEPQPATPGAPPAASTTAPEETKLKRVAKTTKAHAVQQKTDDSVAKQEQPKTDDSAANQAQQKVDDSVTGGEHKKIEDAVGGDDFDVIVNPYGHKRKEGEDLSLAVGKSSLAPVERFPGVVAPVLIVDYLASFEQETLASWIRTSDGKVPIPPTPSRPRALPQNPQPNDFFRRLVQTADNFGDTDQWRALNYLVANYEPLYVCYADMLQHGFALDSVRVIRSRLWGSRRVVDPVFTFVNDVGAIEKYFVRVDVTDLFPNVTNGLTEYFER